MIGFLKELFCNHEWELLDETKVYDNTDFFGRTTEPYYIGKRWVYKCKKCGKMKKYESF